MDTCEWQLDVDCDELIAYDTACGETQYFNEGDIGGNGYVFCPYCGGKIVEAFEAGELDEGINQDDEDL